MFPMELIPPKPSLARRARAHFGSSLLFFTLLIAVLSYVNVLVSTPLNNASAQEIRTITIPKTVAKEEPKAETAPVAQTVATPAPVRTAPAPAATPAPAYDRVTISSIGLNSRFVTVGTTASNNIDVHPSLVGWWNGSSSFGNPGAAFLDGHNPGVFSRLPGIGVGAQITVTRASGEVYNYTVVHTETVPLAGIDMRRALRTWNGASEGLNLMTCVGTYVPSMGTTDQRFIVYAVRS